MYCSERRTITVMSGSLGGSSGSTDGSLGSWMSHWFGAAPTTMPATASGVTNGGTGFGASSGRSSCEGSSSYGTFSLARLGTLVQVSSGTWAPGSTVTFTLSPSKPLLTVAVWLPASW